MSADPEQPPADIEALAAARAEARANRDYPRADELRASIEAAGWNVVDDGPRYSLAPARPPDRRDGDRVVYGSAAGVPSRLGEPPRTAATVIVLAATDRPDEAIATVRGVTASTGLDVDVVVVADGSVDRTSLVEVLGEAAGGPPTEVGDGADPAPGRRIEVLWTIDGMSHGGSLEAGLRRAGGEVVLVIEAGAITEGDLVAPVMAALRDPTVAAVGRDGLASVDLHHFTAPADGSIVALGPTLLGFRRDDASRLEAIDVRLTSYEGLITWSSLALRESRGEGETRRVIALDLPIRPRPDPLDADRSDLVARRDRYRIAARFGADPELAN